VKDPVGNITLFTDASLLGWGAILYTESDDLCVAGSWTPEESELHINLLEIRAVRKALQFLEIGPGSEIALWVDNTTAMGQMQKSYSRAFAHNCELQKIAEIMDQKHITVVSSQYCKSAVNPADALSRGAAHPGPRPLDPTNAYNS
jgi:ribonuclease HI